MSPVCRVHVQWGRRKKTGTGSPTITDVVEPLVQSRENLGETLANPRRDLTEIAQHIATLIRACDVARLTFPAVDAIGSFILLRLPFMLTPRGLSDNFVRGFALRLTDVIHLESVPAES